MRRLGIVEDELVHRHHRAGLQRPLIRLGEVLRVTNLAREARGIPAGDVERLFLRRALEELARVSENNRLIAAAAKPVDGPAFHHGDLDALGREAEFVPRLLQRHLRGTEIERLRAGQPFLVREAGHAGVHHHDAGDEPGDEQDASGDAQPPVDIDEHLAPIE